MVDPGVSSPYSAGADHGYLTSLPAAVGLAIAAFRLFGRLFAILIVLVLLLILAHALFGVDRLSEA